MGQSLFNFAHPKDHDELRKNLKYQDETSNSGISESIVHFLNCLVCIVFGYVIC